MDLRAIMLNKKKVFKSYECKIPIFFDSLKKCKGSDAEQISGCQGSRKKDKTKKW